MKRLWVLLCAVWVCAGCATEGDRAQWEEVKRELRGDNMRMRNDFTGTSSLESQPGQLKPLE
jgi:hypothetical protein